MLLHTLDFLGTIVFAASGALLAAEQNRNGFSVLLYSVFTALGGGTIRDLLLAHDSVFWVRSPAYLWLASTTSILTLLLVKVTRIRRYQLQIADDLSLAIFTLVGAHLTIQSSPFVTTSWLHWIIPPLMGLLTSVGGGMMRDVLGGQTPLLMKRPSDAVTALIGGSFYSLLISIQPSIQHSGPWAIIGSLTLTFGLARCFRKSSERLFVHDKTRLNRQA